MDHTLALIGRAHQGDKEARDRLFEENRGLVYSVARRFQGRGTELEDLCQIGSIGLLKAVDKFDVSFQVKFSTYAVPMIIGEIRRYLRDTGMIKISRSVKENQYRIFRIREEMEKKHGRELSAWEMAEAAGISMEDLTVAMEAGAEVESLCKVIYQGEGNEISLMDKLSEKENGQEKALDRILLEDMLKRLAGDERKLICMRYFRDMTQTEIAGEMGISQVQVSRMEKRILKKMRDYYER